MERPDPHLRAPGRPLLARRTVLLAAGAGGLLAACNTAGDTGDAPLADADAGDEVITDLEQLRADGAVAFEQPDGTLAIAVDLGAEVVAYSSVCTHQGCTVSYDAEDRAFVCPCHRSRFDAENGAAVVTGPAEEPLPRVPVVVDEAAGVLRRG